MRSNQLIGYGLVVGLNNTGDTLSNAVFTRQSLIGRLERLGVNTNDLNASLNTKNVAALMATADLPPSARSRICRSHQRGNAALRRRPTPWYGAGMCSAKPSFLLLAPAPAETVASGNVYNVALVAALRARGHQVATVALPGRFPLADDTARAAAVAALAGSDPDTIVIIDGLALSALDTTTLPARSVALMHHATPLANLVDGETRERLRMAQDRLLRVQPLVIATSDITAERLRQNDSIATTRLVVITPGFALLPRAVGNAGGPCRILSIGALVPRKGHDILLRALARLFDLDWQLTVVGAAGRDPDYADALRRQAQAAGIGARVDFVGEPEPAAMEQLWHQADLFALASRWESYGAIAAQALRRGLPVAVTAGGANAALIPPDAGIICPVDDADGLSKAMRRLIFAPALRRDFAAAASAAGQRLPDWNTQAGRFLDAVTGAFADG